MQNSVTFLKACHIEKKRTIFNTAQSEKNLQPKVWPGVKWENTNVNGCNGLWQHAGNHKLSMLCWALTWGLFQTLVTSSLISKWGEDNQVLTWGSQATITLFNVSGGKVLFFSRSSSFLVFPLHLALGFFEMGLKSKNQYQWGASHRSRMLVRVTWTSFSSRVWKSQLLPKTEKRLPTLLCPQLCELIAMSCEEQHEIKGICPFSFQLESHGP